MEEVDYIFVVLVYKNLDVLHAFYDSIQKITNKKVIIVNSYYDDATEESCRKYAKKHLSDFISVPNNGYSAGNNKGIEYAQTHYNYKYLIVSNSDIVVESLPPAKDLPKGCLILAPKTQMINGKKQNPNLPYDIRFILILYKLYVKYDCKSFLKISYIISRLSRELFFLLSYFRKECSSKIFSAHGCFIIFSKMAVDRLFPLFDERIFLYFEEILLAYKCKHHDVPCIYYPKISVLHLEGASSSSVILDEENKKSCKTIVNIIKNSDYR